MANSSSDDGDRGKGQASPPASRTRSRMEGRNSTYDASRTLTSISDILPADSAAAKAKRIVEFSAKVNRSLNLVKASINHIQDCEGFPCTSCLKSMEDISTVSRHSNIDRNDIADGLGIGTDYCKMFAYTWKKGDMLQKIEEADEREELSHDTTQMFKFYVTLLDCCVIFTDESDYFCLQMEEDGCLSLIVDWLLHLVETDKAMNKWVDDMMFDAMNILHNACRRVPSLALNHHRAVPALQTFGESEDIMTQTIAFMTLAKLVKKEEADKLSTNYTCIVSVLSLLEKCLSDPAHKAKATRKSSKKNGVDVLYLSAEELVQSVDDLAINDNNKRLIVEKGGIPILATLLQRDCFLEEKTYAANGIWTLAFLKENKEKLRKEHDIIYNLSEGSRDTNKKLRDACEGALFEINKTTDVESPQGALSLENEHSGHHAQQQKITKASLGSKASASPRPSASTPVDIPPQGASTAVVGVSTSKARKVRSSLRLRQAKRKAWSQAQPGQKYFDKVSQRL